MADFRPDSGFIDTTITTTGDVTLSYVNTTFVKKTGDTITGDILDPSGPASASALATKAYVDSNAAASVTATPPLVNTSGVLSLSPVSNANISPAAAISLTKLAPLTSSRNVVTDTAGVLTTTNQSWLPLTGGTLTGPLVLPANPSSNLQAATKAYVDSTVGSAPTFLSSTGPFVGSSDVFRSVSLIGGTYSPLHPQFIPPGLFQNPGDRITIQFELETNTTDFDNYIQISHGGNYYNIQPYGVVPDLPKFYYITVQLIKLTTAAIRAWMTYTTDDANYIEYSQSFLNFINSGGGTGRTEFPYTGSGMIIQCMLRSTLGGDCFIVQSNWEFRPAAGSNGSFAAQAPITLTSGIISLSQIPLNKLPALTPNSIVTTDASGYLTTGGSVGSGNNPLYIFVSTTGVDALDRGSITTPLKTITYSVGLTSTAGVCYVFPGSYNESLVLNNRNIAICGSTPTRFVMPTTITGTWQSVGASAVSLRNLTFQPTSGLALQQSASVTVSTLHVESCRFITSNVIAVQAGDTNVFSPTAFNSIIDCDFTQCTGTYGVNLPTTTVSGNSFTATLTLNSTTVTAASVNTNTLAVGNLVSATGLKPGTRITGILSASIFTVSYPATATGSQVVYKPIVFIMTGNVNLKLNLGLGVIVFGKNNLNITVTGQTQNYLEQTDSLKSASYYDSLSDVAIDNATGRLVKKPDPLPTSLVISATLTTAPLYANIGDQYILIGSGAGNWTGYNNTLCQSDDGASVWNFYTPATGTAFSTADTNLVYVFDGNTFNLVTAPPSGSYVSKTGDSMSGFLTLNADPTSGLHATTKQYTDLRVSGYCTVTDWVRFTGVLTANTTNPSLGTGMMTNLARWRRVGSEMEVEWDLNMNGVSGSNGGSGNYFFNMPPGYTINTAEKPLPATVANNTSLPTSCGYLFITASNNNAILQAFVLSNTTVMFLGKNGDGSGPGTFGSTFYSIGPAYQYCFRLKLPIQGWSTGVDPTKVLNSALLFLAVSGSNLTITSTGPVNMPVVDSSSTIASWYSAGRVTVQQTVLVTVHVTVGGSGTTALNIQLYKTVNGVSSSLGYVMGTYLNQYNVCAGSKTFMCNTGNSFYLMPDGASYSNVACWMSVSCTPPMQLYTPNNYLPITGGTATGSIVLAGNPTSGLEAATKQYVDVKYAATFNFRNLYGNVLQIYDDIDVPITSGILKYYATSTERTVALGVNGGTNPNYYAAWGGRKMYCFSDRANLYPNALYKALVINIPTGVRAISIRYHNNVGSSNDLYTTVQVFYVDGAQEQLYCQTMGMERCYPYRPLDNLYSNAGYHNWYHFPVPRAGKLHMTCVGNSNDDFWVSGIAFTDNAYCVASNSAITLHGVSNVSASSGGTRHSAASNGIPWNSSNWNGVPLCYLATATVANVRLIAVRPSTNVSLYLNLVMWADACPMKIEIRTTAGTFIVLCQATSATAVTTPLLACKNLIEYKFRLGSATSNAAPMVYSVEIPYGTWTQCFQNGDTCMDFRITGQDSSNVYFINLMLTTGEIFLS